MRAAKSLLTLGVMGLVLYGIGLAYVGLAQETVGDAGPAAAVGAADGGSFSVQAVLQELQRQYRAGGTTNTFILFLSVLSIAFALERVFRLRRGTIVPTGLALQADALWKQGKKDEILAACDAHKDATLAKIIRFIVRHPHMSHDEVAEVAVDIASRDVGHHHMLTYPLAGIATLAPLLGLYGTVIGMMECFETVAVAGAMGDPSLLAGGIAKALVTTAWGLTVAIPTVFFFNLFKFRTNYLARLLEEESSTLIGEWLMSGEGRA